MDLEAKARDHQKVIDLQENEIAKVKDEVTTYQQLLEVNIECQMWMEGYTDPQYLLAKTPRVEDDETTICNTVTILYNK